MAQSGFTPISLYFSATGAAVPAPGDLVAGELAINTNDGKLYYKNSSGVVTLLASATTVTNSFSAGTTGLTPNTATTGAVTLAGTLAVANGGTGLSSGTSGGVLAYTATGTLASSTALAASALVIGGGAGAAPSTTTTGTGVVTALGVNVGTAGAFVVNGGALGSPSSVGTMPAFTLGGTVSGGGNQINNVVIGTTTPLAGRFTTLSATGTSTLAAVNASAVATVTVSNTSAAVIVNGTSALGGTFFMVQRSGVAKSYFGSSVSISGLGSANDTDIYAVGDGRLFGGDQSTNFTKFTSTGLAVTGTLSATGNITSTTGNVVIGTAGKGIDFSATSSGSGTMTSELLADYEEGTWTPSVGGTATYTTQSGFYTKVGRLVTIQCQLTINVIGTGSTTVISGLPFPEGRAQIAPISVGFFTGLATTVTFLSGYVDSSASTITFTSTTIAGTGMNNAVAIFGSGARVNLTATYQS